MERDTKPRPNRHSSGIILAAAAITAVFAAIAIWNAYHNPTLFNTGTATFILLATAVEIVLARHTRRNEEKTAYYQDIVKRISEDRADQETKSRLNQQA